MHSQTSISPDDISTYLTLVSLLAGAMLTVWLSAYLWLVKRACRTLCRSAATPITQLRQAKPEMSERYVVLVGDVIAGTLLRVAIGVAALPFVAFLIPGALTVLAFTLSASVVHPAS